MSSSPQNNTDKLTDTSHKPNQNPAVAQSPKIIEIESEATSPDVLIQSLNNNFLKLKNQIMMLAVTGGESLDFQPSNFADTINVLKDTLTKLLHPNSEYITLDPALYNMRSLIAHECRNLITQIENNLNFRSLFDPELPSKFLIIDEDNPNKYLIQSLGAFNKFLELLNKITQGNGQQTFTIDEIIATIDFLRCEIDAVSSVDLSFEESLIIRTLVSNIVNRSVSGPEGFKIKVKVEDIVKDGLKIRVIEIKDNIPPKKDQSDLETMNSNIRKGIALANELGDKVPFPEDNSGIKMTAYKVTQWGGKVEVIPHNETGFKTVRIEIPE